MRTVTSFLPQFTSLSAATTLSRALSLSPGATASSRSRQTTSAALAAAFSNSAGRRSWHEQQFGAIKRSRIAAHDGIEAHGNILGSIAVMNCGAARRGRQRDALRFAARASGCAPTPPSASAASVRHMGVYLQSWRYRHGRAWSARCADLPHTFDQMGRESMPQNVRRELGRIDVRLQRQLLQKLVTAAAGQVTFCPARWKQVFALFAADKFRADIEIFGNRLFAASFSGVNIALAAHDEEALLRPVRQPPEEASPVPRRANRMHKESPPCRAAARLRRSASLSVSHGTLVPRRSDSRHRAAKVSLEVSCPCAARRSPRSDRLCASLLCKRKRRTGVARTIAAPATRPSHLKQRNHCRNFPRPRDPCPAPRLASSASKASRCSAISIQRVEARAALGGIISRKASMVLALSGFIRPVYPFCGSVTGCSTVVCTGGLPLST